MSTQYIGTALAAVLPLIALTFIAGAIFSRGVGSAVAFTVLGLVSLGATIATAAWYFDQPFQSDYMGYWYGAVCIAVITIVADW